MEQQVAVFDSHKKAVSALKTLNEQGFPMGHISLIGKAGIIDDHVHTEEVDKATNIPAYVGVGAGTLVGLLSGIGIFAIPGFGVLYGAGALVGAIAGLDLGIVTGGLVSVIAKMFSSEEDVTKFTEHLEEGKFILVVRGNQEEVSKAKGILQTENLHTHLYN
ncbi:hypothetical protein FNO01nite_14990 [Flavobacterium noncentrifugens]|uniref:Heat induced stress protein YflT n=1 Tax=Flavobacterium noncentrifugens TaxID=1128970 RepID=A0A1G8WA46_9FLAO|nr:hypothetical protein [Flavobacterium noncentrifugens]GEP50827.1 hypothetical protein FNO01nite_14990 [Flavobacterium noncentrifugens]SDJ74917.1 hypothetical protein SAMN04487935_1711 [Flavobacterium noncentrifugens]